MDIKFDDKQLNTTLDAIKPGLSPRLQNLKLIAEMIALAAAGTWALFIYLTVQRAANRLSSEQTRYKLEARISIEPKIDIRRLRPLNDGSAAYEVKYKYDISVPSEKKTPIVFVALEWFIGSPRQDPALSFRANLPTTEGSIIWRSRGIEVHSKPDPDTNLHIDLLIGSRTDRSREIIVKQDYEGGVGEYEPGDSVKEERILYVVARPDEWVGFRLTIGVERETPALLSWLRDLVGAPPRKYIEGYYSKDYEMLAVGTPPQEKKIEPSASRPGGGP